jgi:Holliday junction resolvase
MRHRADSNQDEIVQALRDIGASVRITSQVGYDFPDLVVGFRGRNYLMEVKSERGNLTEGQVEFWTNWQGQNTVVFSPDDALKAIGAI